MNTAQINYLNIGLMIVSAAAAFIIPFHLFLFSYAVLGPLHYLTEINWLHKRQYFATGKYDYLLFIGLALFIFLGSSAAEDIGLTRITELSGNAVMFGYVAFASALAMVLIKNTMVKLGAIFVIIVVGVGLQIEQVGWALILFAVMLPTIIHVFIFTGSFILYGALKSKSASGIASLAVFALCAISFFVFLPEAAIANDNYVLGAYSDFDSVNYHLGNTLGWSAQYTQQWIYESNSGLMIMRFIAFAYTYHYLNWFSKTSIIKWHQVNKRTMLIIGAIWAISVVVYAIDYGKGLAWLFFLSFLHVLMEFPLNYRTFIGIGQEVGSMIGLRPAVARK